MSIIKIIIIATIVLGGVVNSAALDYDLTLSVKGKYEFSSDSFGAELDQQREMMENISSERNGLKRLIYGTKKFKDFVFATPIMSEASGWVNESFNVAFDGLNWLTDTVYDIKLEEAVKGAIYKAWVKDKDRIEQAFSIDDHIKKTEEVNKILKDLDDFGTYLGSTNMSTDQRAALNSRMILKLSDITKVIAKNTFQNSAEIEKLKSAKKNYENFKSDHIEELKKYLDFRKQYDDMTEEIHRRGGRAARNIASVMENPNYSQEDIRSGNISENDKQTLKNSMVEIADTMAKAEGYLGKASIIANNLLKGKDAERANKALFYSSNGVKIIGGIASAYGGNPMGAMDAMVGVSNLLGGNKTSPEQQRHTQIMQAFGKVYENQRLIIENQKKMYDLQVKTYKLVANLYNLSRQNFKLLDERIDAVIGNQAAILGNVVEFSDVKENLNYCKDFLNTRFDCRPESLESNGDVFMCISEIKNQKMVGNFRDNFIPYEQPSSTVMVQGYFGSYQDMIDHFNEDQNKSYFRRCHEGLTTILQHDLHPLFVSSTYPIDGSYSTYTEKFIIPIYSPLMKIADKYFMSSQKAANSFYQSLLIPHKSIEALSLKSQRMMMLFADVDEYKMLTHKQVQDALYKHIYMPSLDHYMSSFTEMSTYWDLIDGDVGDSFKLMSESEAASMIDGEGSREIKRYYRKLTKIVEIAVAQQNLISGDIMLPLLRNISKKGRMHPDYSYVESAVKKNYYLGSNLFVYALSSEFDSKPNPEEYYDSYSNYCNDGLGACEWNDNSKTYGNNCKIKFLTETNLPFIFKPDGVFLKNSKDAKIALVKPQELRDKKLVYSPHFYRTLKLKEQLYSRMAKFKGVTEAALYKNPYVLNCP